VRAGRAVGVELVGGEVIPADEVVLAAGVVQDPVLLWRSGIGPADRVRALGIDPLVDLPAVGAHLTDHPVVTVAVPIRPDAAPDGAPSLQTILCCTAPGSDVAHDLQVTPWVRRHADGRRELGMSVSLQLPEGEGSIEPSGPGPSDAARIRWPFTTRPGNVARLRAGWRLALDLAAASGLALDPIALDDARSANDDELDAQVVATHGAFYHGVGTCRAGADPDAGAVVDLTGHVHGVDGLTVVDASVIPTVPRTNTNLIVIALAHHLSDARALAPGRRAPDKGLPVRELTTG
jgi:choline dehydrogenase